MKHRKRIAKALPQRLRRQHAALRERPWSTSGTGTAASPSAGTEQQCSIERVLATEITPQQFDRQYRSRKPVIIEGLTVGWKAHESWTREALLQNYGDRLVQHAGASQEDRQRLNAGQGGSDSTITLTELIKHVDDTSNRNSSKQCDAADGAPRNCRDAAGESQAICLCL